LFIYLENQCRSLFDLKERLDEIFELYRLQLDEGLLVVHDIVIPMQYRNIIGVGVYTGNIDFVKRFISDYEQYVPDFPDRNDLINLCQAICHFGSGEFDKCQLSLNLVSANNLQYKMDERRWRIKTYIELGMYPEVMDQVNNFRRFLSENKEGLSDSIALQNRNFLSVVLKLINLKIMSTSERETVIQEIQQDNTIAEKLWLLNKWMYEY
jgi:hypothetical protein